MVAGNGSWTSREPRSGLRMCLIARRSAILHDLITILGVEVASVFGKASVIVTRHGDGDEIVELLRSIPVSTGQPVRGSQGRDATAAAERVRPDLSVSVSCHTQIAGQPAADPAVQTREGARSHCSEDRGILSKACSWCTTAQTEKWRAAFEHDLIWSSNLNSTAGNTSVGTYPGSTSVIAGICQHVRGRRRSSAGEDSQGVSADATAAWRISEVSFSRS